MTRTLAALLLLACPTPTLAPTYECCGATCEMVSQLGTYSHPFYVCKDGDGRAWTLMDGTP